MCVVDTALLLPDPERFGRGAPITIRCPTMAPGLEVPIDDPVCEQAGRYEPAEPNRIGFLLYEKFRRRGGHCHVNFEPAASDERRHGAPIILPVGRTSPYARS